MFNIFYKKNVVTYHLIKGNATYINDRWTEITGMNTETGLGRGWMTHIIDEDRMLVEKAVKHAISEHQVHFKLEFRYRHTGNKKPSIRWVLGQDLPDIF